MPTRTNDDTTPNVAAATGFINKTKGEISQLSAQLKEKKAVRDATQTSVSDDCMLGKKKSADVCVCVCVCVELLLGCYENIIMHEMAIESKESLEWYHESIEAWTN